MVGAGLYGWGQPLWSLMACLVGGSLFEGRPRPWRPPLTSKAAPDQRGHTPPKRPPPPKRPLTTIKAAPTIKTGPNHKGRPLINLNVQITISIDSLKSVLGFFIKKTKKPEPKHHNHECYDNKSILSYILLTDLKIKREAHGLRYVIASVIISAFQVGITSSIGPSGHVMWDTLQLFVTRAKGAF